MYGCLEEDRQRRPATYSGWIDPWRCVYPAGKRTFGEGDYRNRQREKAVENPLRADTKSLESRGRAVARRPETARTQTCNVGLHHLTRVAWGAPSFNVDALERRVAGGRAEGGCSL